MNIPKLVVGDVDETRLDDAGYATAHADEDGVTVFLEPILEYLETTR